MKTYIIVKDQFPAIHAWENCPHGEVEFLKNKHRHVFHVTVEIEVSHDDRDVEFFMVKKRLTKCLNLLSTDLGSTSCEMLCSKIKGMLELNYPHSINIHSISVFEDNENGARVVFT